MSFIQIIELHTTEIDQIMQNRDEWLAATEGRRTLRRSYVARDRNDPERYLVFALFDSYESAMENSGLPETGAFGQKQAALSTGGPSFTDLDIVSEWSE